MRELSSSFAHLHSSGFHARSLDQVTDEWPSIQDVFRVLSFQSGFNTSLVVLGTTLLGFAAGSVGVFAMLRKRSLMTDALSHATLPGIAIAFLVAASIGIEGKSNIVLLLGATISGVLGVLCVQLILKFSRLREDAAIGLVLSVFFGAGIVGLSYIQANAPAGAGGLNHFIYGQAATMRPSDVYVMGFIAFLALLSMKLFLKEFALVCFNDAFAKVDGWPVSFIDLLMMGLVILVTVAGLQAVGLILVVAMLIIPAVAARFWTEKMWGLLVIAGLIGASSGYCGSVISALFPRKPAGAVIVLTAGGFFLVSLFFAPQRGIVALTAKRFALRVRIAGDHLLEHAFENHVHRLNHDSINQFALNQGWGSFTKRLILWTLTNNGSLANHDSECNVVTQQGLERGQRVSRNHSLWEQYLISHADIATSHVDWSVDQVEHVLNDELVEQLERELMDRGIDVSQSTINQDANGTGGADHGV